jgi:hypothetical protein
VTKIVVKAKPKKKKGLLSALSAEPWRKELKDLADIYSGLEIAQIEIRQKNNQVFKSIETLETQKEGVKIKIQTIARARAKQGHTLNLVNLPWVTVQVCGNQERQNYSFDEAVEHWPEDILSQVLTVDSKCVEELLAEGRSDFTEKVAAKAALPRQAKTAAVSIKVKPDDFVKRKVKATG